MDDGPNIRDTRMQGRAIRERWSMSEPVRAGILQRLVSIVDPEYVHEIGRPGFREVIAAARALIAADRDNLAWAQFDHATQPPERPTDDFVIDLSAPEDDPSQPRDGPAA